MESEHSIFGTSFVTDRQRNEENKEKEEAAARVKVIKDAAAAADKVITSKARTEAEAHAKASFKNTALPGTTPAKPGQTVKF